MSAELQRQWQRAPMSEAGLLTGLDSFQNLIKRRRNGLTANPQSSAKNAKFETHPGIQSVRSLSNRSSWRLRIVGPWQLVVPFCLKSESRLQFDDAPGKAAQGAPEVRVGNDRTSFEEANRSQVNHIENVEGIRAQFEIGAFIDEP